MTSTAVLKAEAYKLRSLTSTPWLLGITTVVSLVLSGLAVRSPMEGEEPGISEVMVGPAFAQFLVMVFAARSATMEFRTGTIWQSRLAVPSWPRLLLGKAGVIATLAALMGILMGAGESPSRPSRRPTPMSCPPAGSNGVNSSPFLSHSPSWPC